MPKNVALRETATITEAAAKSALESGRLPIQLISPGWGSSGYYSPKVLEQAAADRVIPKGTHMYADHPTEAEEKSRPGRSIKDLIGVTVEDAKLSTKTGALIAEVEVVEGWRGTLKTIKDHIGVSIRGDATDITEGEAEGRTGRIIEGLAHVASVDFVTRAGRGGKVLDVLESALRENAVLEATASDRTQQLRQVLQDKYATEKTYVWVRDHDAEQAIVWFELSARGRERTFQQSYSIDDNDVDLELLGKPVEVRGVTKYVPVNDPKAVESATEDVPVNDPAGRTTPTTRESKEDPMAETKIEESELKALREEAGRVTVLEAERDTAIGERDQSRAREAARDIIAEAKEVTFSALEIRGLLADLPLKEGALDVEAFTATIEEQVKQAKEDAARVQEQGGAGRVTNFGTTSTSTGKTDAELREASDKVRASAFGHEVKGA